MTTFRTAEEIASSLKESARVLNAFLREASAANIKVEVRADYHGVLNSQQLHQIEIDVFKPL